MLSFLSIFDKSFWFGWWKIEYFFSKGVVDTLWAPRRWRVSLGSSSSSEFCNFAAPSFSSLSYTSLLCCCCCVYLGSDETKLGNSVIIPLLIVKIQYFLVTTFQPTINCSSAIVFHEVFPHAFLLSLSLFFPGDSSDRRSSSSSYHPTLQINECGH